MVKISKICIAVFVFFSITIGNSAIAQKSKILSCKATYYHNKFSGVRTSSGEIFSQKLYTAAHRSIPLQTIVKVTNKRSGRWLLVKINDRCARGGILDLSCAAYNALALRGAERVDVEVLGKDYLDVWNRQNELIGLDTVTYNERIYVIEQLLLAKRSNLDGSFYVRLATISSENEVIYFKRKLPKKYALRMNIKKIYGENFYYVNIGPFATKKSAEDAIIDLKKEYPLAHLINKN